MTLERLRNGLARRLSTTEGLTNPDRRRALWLRHHGITLVLDVGANTGQYVAQLRTASEYTGRVVSFEPGSDAFATLTAQSERDTSWECHRLALGDVRGRATLQLAQASVLNSFLPQRTGAPPVGTEEVDVALLDEVAPAHIRSNDRVLLKIDVQGYEAAVLRGATDMLKGVDVIECEIPLTGIYDAQPECRDLIDTLDELGFVPFSVQPNYVDPQTGHVVDADFVFARRVAR